MKKLLFILTVAFAISCTKEKNVNSRIDNMVGNYVGAISYHNYYSLDTLGGYQDQEGQADSVILIIERTSFNGNDLKLTWVIGTNQESFYAKNVVEDDASQIYFEIPTQLDIDGQVLRGNRCEDYNSQVYDGIFVISTNQLNFCTHRQLITPTSDKVYGESNETYTKQ